ncbi:MAG: threonine/homoserine/homoserine lactone efflux protein [Psychromonas sp.]|jgi:threonine/homoserine/homoserine lactone efflux protein|uniref:LysE family translocator n=1 Tax=Psychromonas sp. TaxID=1884585 RepID=UPI0039E4313F
MENSLLFALTLFAFVMSVTPGPNNIMLLSSGAQFGYKRTLPHIAGIIIGVALLLTTVLLGFAAVFQLYPAFYQILQVVGCIYLLWLAWKIATAPTDTNMINTTANRAQPMNIISAVTFQFINPKAWAMGIGSVTTFTIAGEQYLTSGLWIISCFAVMGFIGISIWAVLGVAIGRYLTSQSRKKWFNYLMGVLTAATVFLIIAT